MPRNADELVCLRVVVRSGLVYVVAWRWFGGAVACGVGTMNGPTCLVTREL